MGWSVGECRAIHRTIWSADRIEIGACDQGLVGDRGAAFLDQFKGSPVIDSDIHHGEEIRGLVGPIARNADTIFPFATAVPVHDNVSFAVNSRCNTLSEGCHIRAAKKRARELQELFPGERNSPYGTAGHCSADSRDDQVVKRPAVDPNTLI